MLFNKVLFTIFACALVTWLSRILPFVFLKYFKIPSKINDFLVFVPVVLMASLWFSSLFTAKTGHLPQLNWAYFLASLPTLGAAILSKSLLVIVAVGIISLAIIRAIT